MAQTPLWPQSQLRRLPRETKFRSTRSKRRGVDSKDHDVSVLKLLETARMNGIKFNPKKLQFKSSKCEFFGHTLTPEGMKIDDRKVEAIKQMSAPKDKKGLQSFQGMIKVHLTPKIFLVVNK